MRAALAVLLCWLALPLPAAEFPPVVADRPLVFPQDFGAHPDFRTEWWYVTGWLTDEAGVERGFQVTFFRVRTGLGEDDPGRFAPRQIVLAHAAVADPAEGRLLHAERSGRVLPPLAGADAGRTRVWVGNWSLEQTGDAYQARIEADGFSFELAFVADRPPVLNGREGYSRKAPGALNASYYYSRPQLAVSGRLNIGQRALSVTGEAWLDHEWSSELMPEDAQGWDWIGINLVDGGSLMAFRMRDARGGALWAGGTLVDRDGRTRSLAPDEVAFVPRRVWRSPRSATEYTVAWEVLLAGRALRVVPLMDDQELDGRASTGAIYWEGAVRVLDGDAEIGRGYLEMTGYRDRLVL